MLIINSLFTYLDCELNRLGEGNVTILLLLSAYKTPEYCSSYMEFSKSFFDVLCHAISIIKLFTLLFKLFPSSLMVYVSIEGRWPLSEYLSSFLFILPLILWSKIVRVRPQTETGVARYLK